MGVFLQSLQAVDTSRFATVNQTSPSAAVSKSYKFIPTSTVLEVLGDHGWIPTQVKESRTRKVENEGYQKHALRLVNESVNRELEVGGTIPQIMLTNSHSGTAAFELHIGLLELVCRNGLLVDRHSVENLRVLHRGYADSAVEAAVRQIAGELPSVLERVEKYRTVLLTRTEQEAYASAAIELRFDGEKYAVQPSDLLRVIHPRQAIPTLWNTYNVVQEAVIKGGVRQWRRDGTRVRSKEVKSIDQNTKLNKALWTLTEKMAGLKGQLA